MHLEELEFGGHNFSMPKLEILSEAELEKLCLQRGLLGEGREIFLARIRKENEVRL